MTNHVPGASGQVLGDAAESALRLPTVADLDPIANFIAMRFALAGVSSSKVFQVLEILHYHCLQMEGCPPRVAFELSKLISWMDKSRGDFRDVDALGVLQTALNWYDKVARQHGGPPARLRIKRSVSDLLALVTWKYKCFDVDKQEFKAPWVLGLAVGGEKVGLYLRGTDRGGRPRYTTARLDAGSVQSLQDCHGAIGPVNRAIMRMRSLDEATEIRGRLDDAIEDLGMGWRARLAVGIPVVEPLSDQGGGR